jgi:hypothetical protein
VLATHLNALRAMPFEIAHVAPKVDISADLFADRGKFIPIPSSYFAWEFRISISVQPSCAFRENYFIGWNYGSRRRVRKKNSLTAGMSQWTRIRE